MSTITLDDGRALGYDKLLITTGAEPRRLSGPGSDLEGIYYLGQIPKIGVDTGVYLEVTKGFGGESDGGEAKLLLAKTQGRFQGLFNFIIERPFNGPVDAGEITALFRDFKGDDVAYRYESWWDLWQFDSDWALRPARILLSCFGPDFDNGTERKAVEQEDLRIDFGVDSNYLPQIGIPGGAKLTESNIRSLLRLVHEIDSALPVEIRRLETESGENFADRLQQSLTPVERLQ